jgi:hypothetical protein
MQTYVDDAIVPIVPIDMTELEGITLTMIDNNTENGAVSQWYNKVAHAFAINGTSTIPARFKGDETRITSCSRPQVRREAEEGFSQACIDFSSVSFQHNSFT